MKLDVKAWARAFKLGAEKAAPGVMIAVGIAAVAVGSYKAAEATPVVKEAVEEFKTNREEIEQTEMDPETKKELVTTSYKKLGNSVLHAYGKPVLLVATGTGLILGGHGIVSKKLATTTASLISTDKLFQNYRQNVIEDQGEDADFRYRTGLKTVEVESVEHDTRGRKRKVKKEMEVVDNVIGNPFMKFFDEANPNFEKNPSNNLFFLKKQEEWRTRKLRAEGFLFLNDVLYELGYGRCAEGSVYGWVYDEDDPECHNVVSFGIRNTRRPTVRNAMNGYEPVILLDFNVDGVIVEKLPKFGQYGR
jgi:hypothetical protein